MTSLIKYDAACRAVSEALSVDEVKSILQEAEAMRAYAKQAKNKKLETDASEIRFRAERRLGELMAKQREAGLLSKGGGDGSNQYQRATGLKTNPVAEKPISLLEAGIDKNLADRARKYAAVPAEQFEEILADRRERIATENKRVTLNLMEAGVRGTLGTGDNEWFTPAEWIDRARTVLGVIDLDPASNERAQRTVQALQFYTAADDGLTKAWHGNVWLNPPYAQPHIEDFADKMLAEVASGHVDQAIMLTHNYTDTAWCQKLMAQADAMCLPRGRIRFEAPDGSLAAPTQGQALFYFGGRAVKFAEVFAPTGKVWLA